MSKQEHNEDTRALIEALLASAPQRLTTSPGRWIWVAGKLAAMIIRWGRMDWSIRQEVQALIEKSKNMDRRL